MSSARNRQYADEHRTLMNDRNLALDQHVRDLQTNQTSNTQLAARYRQLDNRCMLLKDKLLNQVEECLQLENSLKDTKQVSKTLIQQRTLTDSGYKFDFPTDLRVRFYNY